MSKRNVAGMAMLAKVEDEIVVEGVKDEDDNVADVVAVFGVTVGDIFIMVAGVDVADEDSEAGDDNFMQI